METGVQRFSPLRGARRIGKQPDHANLDSREPTWGIVLGPTKKQEGIVTRDLVIHRVRYLNRST